MVKKKEEVEQTFEEKIAALMDNVSASVGKDKLKLISAGFERQECAPFGLPSLDAALNGGIPYGNMVELAGPEGGGKTTLGLHLLGNQARRGQIIVPVDAEHKLDPILCKTLGVDLQKYPFSQPSTAEEAFSVIESSAQVMSRGDAFLVDSAAALVPKAELEGTMTDQFYGGNSKVISHGLHKITSIIGNNGIVVVFINQIREKIGVAYGNPETTPCGRALKHSCATRMEVRKSGFIKEGDKIVGQDVRIRIIKATHCAPYVDIPLKLFFGKGFSKEYSLLDLAVQQGIINQTGAWYEFGGNKFHGQSQLIEYLSTEEGYNNIFSKVKI